MKQEVLTKLNYVEAMVSDIRSSLNIPPSQG